MLSIGIGLHIGIIFVDAPLNVPIGGPCPWGIPGGSCGVTRNQRSLAGSPFTRLPHAAKYMNRHGFEAQSPLYTCGVSRILLPRA